MGDNEYATLKYQNKEYQFPIIKSSLGPDAISITNLYKEADILTYDPGFMSTASCQSSITYVDGNKGILEYRGYPIADLATKSDFLSVIYLLINGELPNYLQKQQLSKTLGENATVDKHIKNLFNSFPNNAHPMAMMVSATGGLAALYHEEFDIKNPEHRAMISYRVLAQLPILAAMAYRHNQNLAPLNPAPQLGYVENFFHMMFSNNTTPYQRDPIIVKALDTIFTLHADHEQNASTSTLRLVASSGANPFACVAAAIASLWGPAHGGANEAVIKMLEEIGTIENIARYIARAKDPDDSFRLMGFGHRVYKNYDPRAAIIKDICHQVIAKLNSTEDRLLKIATKLEEIALNDDYFTSRKLFPNVDFYSGIIYKALNIPTNMYTVLFALARSAGWMAQWQEMMSDSENKIGRPRQVYIGKIDQKLP